MTQVIRHSIDKLFKYKTLTAKEVSYNEVSRTVSGYLAAFGNVDDAGDRLVKGCFAKSIQEHGPDSSSHRKIAYCWQHDMTTPIGKFTILREDDYGLYFEAVLDDIPLVNDIVISQYQSGTLNQHSIGFWYVQLDETSELTEGGYPVWNVKEVQLIEGSVVTAGCNENTPFLGFKAIAGGSLYKELSQLTNELAYMKQMRIKQLFDALIQESESTRREPSSRPSKPQADRKSINELFKTKNEH
jgi:HK97 family phage prohead protease